MIKSMTGFARCQSKHSFGTLTWELRSVNHRYLDINLRMPDEMRSYENRYRELINARLGRGKVEGGLRFKPEVAIEDGIEINDAFAKSLVKACQRINDILHQPSEINAVEILNWPGVVKEIALDMKPVLDASVELLESALNELVENREREGARLHEMVMQRCKGMRDQVEQVRTQMPEIRQLHREKLMARLTGTKSSPRHGSTGTGAGLYCAKDGRGRRDRPA